jgi:hypothetical protein
VPKDSVTLNRYAQEKKTNKIAAQHPSSARSSKGAFESKRLLGKKNRHGSDLSKMSKYSQPQFDEYMRSLGSTQEVADPKSKPQKLDEVLRSQESLSKIAKNEAIRNSKDFRIRKGSTAKEKIVDVNEFLKFNKYPKVE